MELTKEQKQAVIDERLAQWKLSLYGHTVDMRVGKNAGFDDVVTSATANARRAQVMIDALEEERAALDKPPTT